MTGRVKTTLWEVVAAIQSKLEGLGLEPHVVDSAVVLGVETMLAGPGRVAAANDEEARQAACWGLGTPPACA